MRIESVCNYLHHTQVKIYGCTERVSLFCVCSFFVCEFYTFLATIVELNLAEVITKPNKLAVECKKLKEVVPVNNYFEKFV